MTHNKLKSRQVRVLFLILFTDMIGFGMSLPLFGLLFGSATNPFYVGNVLDVANIALYFGLFSGLYGLGQFVANPILGALSDTVGRKPVLSFAIFGTLVARIIFLVGLLQMNIFLMFFSRFIDGATGGIISLSNASITDTTAPEERAKYIGKTMAGFSLGGFVAGPIIFTLFSYSGDYYSVVGPFILAAILSLISFLSCLIFLPETLAKDKIQRVPNPRFLLGKVVEILVNLKFVFNDKSIKPFFIGAGIFYFAFAGFNTFSSPYLFSAYSLSSTQMGVYFLTVGIIMTIMQAFVAYKLVKKYPYKFSSFYIGGFLALGMLIFTYAQLVDFSLAVLFINAALFTFFVSVNMVSLQTEISKIKTENKGALLGAFSSVQVLAMAAAPIILGIASKHFETAPFLVGAILVIVSGAVFKKSL